MTQVLFWTDGSPRIGAGHVMRCLAFAEVLAWAGWRVTFAVGPDAKSVAPSLLTAGHRIVETVSAAEVLMLAGPSTRIVVIDNYELCAEHEARFRKEGRAVIVFDDLADRLHACDVVVDPTPRRGAAAYRRLIPAQASVLAGPRYAPIRRAFLVARSAARARHRRGVVHRILVSAGATDPADATSAIIQALALLNNDLQIDIVLGAGAPHLGRVAQGLAPNMRLHVDPPDLASLVAAADLAIGTGGSSNLERAVLGVPAILLPVADNQRLMVEQMASAGAAMALSSTLFADREAFAAEIVALIGDRCRLIEMARSASHLTDGRGALRLLLVLADICSRPTEPDSVFLRLAESEDSAWLLGLQRQRGTRRHARNPDIPTAEEHEAWFEASLENPDRILAIVERHATPVGMIRLDRLAGAVASFEVSIAIDEQFRRRGMGRAALGLIRRILPGAQLVATVSPDNRNSLRLFASAGYQQDADGCFRSWAQ